MRVPHSRGENRRGTRKRLPSRERTQTERLLPPHRWRARLLQSRGTLRHARMYAFSLTSHKKMWLELRCVLPYDLSVHVLAHCTVPCHTCHRPCLPLAHYRGRFCSHACYEHVG